MSFEELPQEAPSALEGIVAVSRPVVSERLKIEDGLAKERGLLLDGTCVRGSEPDNYKKYGAESPKERYCKMFPAITVEDLAKDWGIEPSIMRAWATAGKWDAVRDACLETVPLEAGGRLASGDLAVYKHNLIFEHLRELKAAREIVNKRLNERTEEQVGKMSVEELRKSSKSINEDVQSLVMLEAQERTTVGLPTKYSATMTQTTTEKRKVVASVVQAPQQRGVLRAPIEPSSTITTTTTQTLEAG